MAEKVGMSWRQRRRAGVTIRNLVRTARELRDADELPEGESEAAAAILYKIVADKPELMNDPSFDWDGLLAFIERLLPLILKLIEIFGA